MIIDEKGKLFGKISIIDLAVIVILVLSVIGGALIYGFSGSDAGAGEISQIKKGDIVNELTLKLAVEDVREITKDALTPGTEVFAANSKKLLGVIDKVESTPRRELITGVDGKMVYAQVPEKYDISIYLKGWGIKTSTGCITEFNQKLMPGEDIIIKTVLVKTTPIIEDITENTEVTKTADNPRKYGN